jgi:hypothetical protein
MISAKSEPDPVDDDVVDEVDPPRLPAVVLAELPVEELDDEPPVAVLDVDPAVTESPGARLSSETTVPLTGA